MNPETNKFQILFVNGLGITRARKSSSELKSEKTLQTSQVNLCMFVAPRVMAGSLVMDYGCQAQNYINGR